MRLTVSPDAKSKTCDSERKNTKRTRLKSRRLFKHDDDEDGCLELNPETEKIPPIKQVISDTSQHKIPSIEKSNGIKNDRCQLELSNVMSKDITDDQITPCCANINGELQRQVKANEATESVYAPILSNENFASTAKSMYEKVTLNDNHACCQDCQTSTPNYADGMYISRPCMRRIVRKSRKKMHYHHPATRTRSLSVGNENNYRNNNGDASSGASGKGRNDECLNNLRRNDLIDIIRESMEKSRLCFQSNG